MFFSKNIIPYKTSLPHISVLMHFVGMYKYFQLEIIEKIKI